MEKSASEPSDRPNKAEDSTSDIFISQCFPKMTQIIEFWKQLLCEKMNALNKIFHFQWQRAISNRKFLDGS